MRLFCEATSADHRFKATSSWKHPVRITITDEIDGRVVKTSLLDLKNVDEFGDAASNAQTTPILKRKFSLPALLRGCAPVSADKPEDPVSLAVSINARYAALVDRGSRLFKWDSRTNLWSRIPLPIDASTLISNVCVTFVKYQLCVTFVRINQQVDFERFEYEVCQVADDGTMRSCCVPMRKRDNIVLFVSDDSTLAYIDDMSIALHIPTPAVLPSPQTAAEDAWLRLACVHTCPDEALLSANVPDRADWIIANFCLDRHRNMAVRIADYAKNGAQSPPSRSPVKRRSAVMHAFLSFLRGDLERSFDEFIETHVQSKGQVIESLPGALSMALLLKSAGRLESVLRCVVHPKFLSSRQPIEMVAQLSKELTLGQKMVCRSLAALGELRMMSSQKSKGAFALMPTRITKTTKTIVSAMRVNGSSPLDSADIAAVAASIDSRLVVDLFVSATEVRSALAHTLHTVNHVEFFRLAHFLGGSKSVVVRNELRRAVQQSAHRTAYFPALWTVLMSDGIDAGALSAELRVWLLDDLLGRTASLLKSMVLSVQRSEKVRLSLDGLMDSVAKHVLHIESTVTSVVRSFDSSAPEYPTISFPMEDDEDVVELLTMASLHLTMLHETDAAVDMSTDAPLQVKPMKEVLHRVFLRCAYMLYLLLHVQEKRDLASVYIDLMDFGEFFARSALQQLVLDLQPDVQTFQLAGLHMLYRLPARLRAASEAYARERSYAVIESEDPADAEVKTEDIEDDIFEEANTEPLNGFASIKFFFSDPQARRRISFGYETKSAKYTKFLDDLDRAMRFVTDMHNMFVFSAQESAIRSAEGFGSWKGSRLRISGPVFVSTPRGSTDADGQSDIDDDNVEPVSLVDVQQESNANSHSSVFRLSQSLRDSVASHADPPETSHSATMSNVAKPPLPLPSFVPTSGFASQQSQSQSQSQAFAQHGTPAVADSPRPTLSTGHSSSSLLGGGPSASSSPRVSMLQHSPVAMSPRASAVRFSSTSPPHPLLQTHPSQSQGLHKQPQEPQQQQSDIPMTVSASMQAQLDRERDREVLRETATNTSIVIQRETQAVNKSMAVQASPTIPVVQIPSRNLVSTATSTSSFPSPRVKVASASTSVNTSLNSSLAPVPIDQVAESPSYASSSPRVAQSVATSALSAKRRSKSVFIASRLSAEFAPSAGATSPGSHDDTDTVLFVPSSRTKKDRRASSPLPVGSSIPSIPTVNALTPSPLPSSSPSPAVAPSAPLVHSNGGPTAVSGELNQRQDDARLFVKPIKLISLPTHPASAAVVSRMHHAPANSAYGATRSAPYPYAASSEAPVSSLRLLKVPGVGMRRDVVAEPAPLPKSARNQTDRPAFQLLKVPVVRPEPTEAIAVQTSARGQRADSTSTFATQTELDGVAMITPSPLVPGSQRTSQKKKLRVQLGDDALLLRNPQLSDPKSVSGEHPCAPQLQAPPVMQPLPVPLPEVLLQDVTAAPDFGSRYLHVTSLTESQFFPDAVDHLRDCEDDAATQPLSLSQFLNKLDALEVQLQRAAQPSSVVVQPQVAQSLDINEPMFLSSMDLPQQQYEASSTHRKYQQPSRSPVRTAVADHEHEDDAMSTSMLLEEMERMLDDVPAGGKASIRGNGSSVKRPRVSGDWIDDDKLHRAMPVDRSGQYGSKMAVRHARDRASQKENFTKRRLEKAIDMLVDQ